MAGPRKLKHGELEVRLLKLTKSDLECVPHAHRSFYLLLGQFNNELFVLHSLLIQALNGAGRGGLEQEAMLGTVLFLARLSSGKLYELRDALNAKDNRKLLEDLWATGVMRNEPRDTFVEALDGRRDLNRYFGTADALLERIRNKLAFHHDQSEMDEGFRRLPDDIELTEFHTGARGTTFLGPSDTVTVYTMMQLGGFAEPGEAVDAIIADATSMFRAATNFVDGYTLAFGLNFFGETRIRNMERIVIKQVPALDNSRLNFFFRLKKLA